MSQSARDLLIVLPPPPATVHFIGIGGISMSGLASMVLDWGFNVTGSDAKLSDTTSALASRGVRIVVGHQDPGLAGRADVIVSTRRAEMQARIELEAGEANGAIILKRGQFIASLARERRSFAVAGTHGKSTTSGMITTALAHLGRDPSFALGAVLPGFDATTGAGDGPEMVVEADEFDRSFLWLSPDVAIVTSISFDHPDIYDSQDDYDNAFLQFCKQITPGGTLLIAADDPGCRRVLERLRAEPGAKVAIQTFGETEEADWRLVTKDEGGWVVMSPSGVSHHMKLGVVGRHNARNAVVALGALAVAGIAVDDAIAGLVTFSGVGRRFERKGSFAGIDVVDDYAHHPEEIQAVTQAARDAYPGRRLVVVHQPHTFSRTKLLLTQFGQSLDGADVVVLLDIYPSGETDTLGLSSAHLRDEISVPTSLVPGPSEAASHLGSVLRPGDVLLTLGAGDITRTAQLVVDDLKAHEAAASPGAAPARRSRPASESFDLPGPGPGGIKVMRDASMGMFTTMRLGGRADFLVRAPSPAAIVQAVQWASDQGLSTTVIGGGSNLLVSDEGIRGLVIVCRTPGERALDLVEVEERDDYVVLKVGSQAPLSWLGRFCSEQGWAGMDWGVGLPGQIGGASTNNAGAHGTEIKDRIVGLDILMDDGSERHVDLEWLDPSYRSTTIKAAPRPRPWTILRTHLRLERGDRGELVALADDHAAFRKRTQPTGACSGSTFANPPGQFAGRLLEAAGLKGYKIGAMQLSPKHANWVVNSGGGRAEDAWALIEHARAVVLERFGVTLYPEIERVGNFNDEPQARDGVHDHQRTG